MKKLLFIQDFYQKSDVENQKVFSSPTAQNFLSFFRSEKVELFFETLFPLLDEENVKVPTEQARESRATLIGKIIQINPDIIVPLGAQTMKVLTGSVQFASEMGSVLHINKLGKFEFSASLVPMYHPDKIAEFPSYLDKINRCMGTLIAEIHSNKVDTTSSATDRVLANLDYKSLETVDDVKEAFRTMINAPVVAFDIETTGLEYWHDDSKIICISFSYKEGQGYVIPLQHPQSPFSESQLSTVKSLLKDFLESDIEKVAHNGKFDTQWLKFVYGIDVKNWNFDTMYAHFLAVSEEKRTQGLKYNGVLYTSIGNYEEELQNFLKTLPEAIRYNYGNVPWEILRKYAMADTDCCLRLYNAFKPLVDGNEDWKWLMDNIYMPVAKVLRDIEIDGMHFDNALAEKYQETYSNELNRIDSMLVNNPTVLEIEQDKRKLFEERVAIGKIPAKERTAEEKKKFLLYKKYEDWKFSWSSPGCLRELLYDKLKLPVTEKTDKGEASTSESALQELSKYHSIPKLILERRKVETLYKMFVQQLPGMATKDGILHPTFSIHLTVTGRTNCANPKLSWALGL